MTAHHEPLDPRWAIIGHGQLKTISIANPLIGKDFVSDPVPPRRAWRILSGGFHFVTSAIVANRQARLVIRDPALIIAMAGPSQNAPANSSVDCQLNTGGSPAIGAMVPLAFSGAQMWAPPYGTISSSVLLLDVGDQISDINFLVEEFDYRCFAAFGGGT